MLPDPGNNTSAVQGGWIKPGFLINCYAAGFKRRQLSALVGLH